VEFYLSMKFNRSVFFNILTIFLTLLIFWLIKLAHLEFHFGDGNVYYYMADRLLQGTLPYRDFLIADPPLLVILLAGIKLLIGNQLILFQTVPLILESITAVLLFFLSRQQLPKLAKFIPALYLFSFLILSTTDYLTGLHFVNCLIVLAYFFRKKPYLSGIFWGLATLIKLYVIPGFIGWMIVLFMQKKWPQFKKTAIAYIATGALIMLPFLILSPDNVINHIILHQFNRPKGLSKLNIFRFFIQHDLLLLLTVGFNFYLTKHKKFLIPLLCWLIFYVIFKDLYYLYLGVMAPWIILSLVNFWQALEKKLNCQKNNLGSQLVLMSLIMLFFTQIIGLNFYQKNIQQQGVFTQAPAVAEYINTLPTKPLYGSHEVAPLVALLSHRQLFDHQIDTNAQLFGSGALDKNEISQAAAEQGVYLLTKVADIPQSIDLNQGYDGYFSPTVFEQACQRLKIINGNDGDLFDDVAVYDCHF